MVITIDCTGLESPRQLHRVLAQELAFPEHYGCNLDALHDCLTEISEETKLRLVRFNQLGSFSMGFRRVLQDCEAENPGLQVLFL